MIVLHDEGLLMEIQTREQWKGERLEKRKNTILVMGRKSSSEAGYKDIKIFRQ